MHVQWHVYSLHRVCSASDLINLQNITFLLSLRKAANHTALLSTYSLIILNTSLSLFCLQLHNLAVYSYLHPLQPFSISHSFPLWGPEMNYRCLFCDSFASGSTSSLSKMTFPAARCTWDISSSPLSVWLASCSPGSSEGRSHWYLSAWHRSHGESLLLCS